MMGILQQEVQDPQNLPGAGSIIWSVTPHTNR
jgi:hypothetical protein